MQPEYHWSGFVDRVWVSRYRTTEVGLRLEYHHAGLVCKDIENGFAARVLLECMGLQIEYHRHGLQREYTNDMGLQIEFHRSGFADRVPPEWVCR